LVTELADTVTLVDAATLESRVIVTWFALEHPVEELAVTSNASVPLTL
jgi:hypothetical protein